MKLLTIGIDEMTSSFLERQGCICEVNVSIHDPDDLAAWLIDLTYAAALVDLDVTNLGLYFPRLLREQRIATPVIGIMKRDTERSWSETRAIFLENGGDELLQFPANPRELLASIRAVARRFKGGLLDIVTCRKHGHELKINLTSLTVSVNGISLHLTGREFAMLEFLAMHPNRVVSKEMFLETLYVEGVHDQPDMKIIDVFICKLRAKIDEVEKVGGDFIETVWGRGYKLCADDIEKAGVHAA